MISLEKWNEPGMLEAEKVPSELMTNFGVDPLSCVGTYWLDDSLITQLPTTSIFVWLQPIRNSTASTQSPNRLTIRTSNETPTHERLLPIRSGQCGTDHARWPGCKKSGDLSEVRGQPPVDYPLVPVGGPRLKAESQHLDEHRDGQTQCREHWPNDHRIDDGLGPKGSHLSSAER